MPDLPDLLDDLASGDEQRAQTAVTDLATYGSRAVKPLRELLSHPDPDVRWWATYALSEFNDKEAQASLIDALKDEEVSVRCCAALGLRLNPTTKAIDRLVTALQSDDLLLSRLAGDALAAIGPKSIRALQPLTQSPSPHVRIEAVRALAQMGHPDAIGPLFACSGDPSSMVAHWVEVGLDRLGVGMSFFRT